MSAGTFDLGGDLRVGRLGFGAMRLPTAPGADRAGAVAVLRRAVELGVTLLDTAHMYGWGANEELLAEALHPWPAGVVVATKVGIVNDGPAVEAGPPTGARVDGRPEVLRAQVTDALRRLRMERLELLQLHRIDPAVPLADQLGTLAELQAAGRVGRIGLSEVTAGELAQARALVDVASVQNRYSVADRAHEAVLAACEAAGIAFLPWRPVAGTAGGEVGAVAAELGATAGQVALAWLLARSPVLLPIPGTARIAHLEENVAAAGLELSAGQLARLDRVAG